ncbi:MAG: hypothetical protein WC343_01725 [Bacilli bacterium]
MPRIPHRGTPPRIQAKTSGKDPERRPPRRDRPARAPSLPGDRPDPGTGDPIPGPFLIRGRSTAIRGAGLTTCTCRSLDP